MDAVERYIAERYGPSAPPGVVEALSRHWRRFRDAGLAADPHFVSELCSGSATVFYQRYWEIALGNMLLDHGLRVDACPGGKGPDFRVTTDDATI